MPAYKSGVLKKVVTKTGLGHHPGQVRDHIRRFAKDKTEKAHLLRDYDRLMHDKPLQKNELKVLLKELGDKDKFHISGTYLQTTAHNPEEVIRKARHLDDAEHRAHMLAQSQQPVEELTHDQHDNRATQGDRVVSLSEYRAHRSAPQPTGKKVLPPFIRKAA